MATVNISISFKDEEQKLWFDSVKKVQEILKTDKVSDKEVVMEGLKRLNK